MVVVVVVVVVVCAGTEKGSRVGSWNTGGSEKREKEEGSRVKGEVNARCTLAAQRRENGARIREIVVGGDGGGGGGGGRRKTTENKAAEESRRRKKNEGAVSWWKLF
ncbi:hypothetical protein ALC60_06502 [Trachymyrmex zeteki]|uniref:Secreted protein n=1 Tax=Mycetomoellerius zeteki TaxID=64791 RepID=A0A151X2F6_9HYME|nr:hypothetical protein ALC60_06502 [Trachymyrmex zeteki]